MNTSLIVPSKIPWESIKDKDLEEMLYWLFESMGAKDLEWRIGSSGKGASDQGRDIECYFYLSSPEGDLTRQKWWIDAKGRTATVEPSVVKEAVLNVSGKKDIDVLVIATNSAFSNPTRDWVKEWQQDNPRPTIKLWEKYHLEKFCSKHPLPVLRLFLNALSPQGCLEVVRSKLWNHIAFSEEKILQTIWDSKDSIGLEPESLFALISSEYSNGNINYRSWGAFANDKLLIESLYFGLINAPYLILKINEFGVKQDPIIKAFAYLILTSIHTCGANMTAKLVKNVWENESNNDSKEVVKTYILAPILDMLISEISDVCANNCERLSPDPSVLSKEEIERYWDRLELNSLKPKEKNTTLILESTTKPCNAGFDLNEERLCPLFQLQKPETKIEKTLSIVEIILKSKRSSV